MAEQDREGRRETLRAPSAPDVGRTPGQCVAALFFTRRGRIVFIRPTTSQYHAPRGPLKVSGRNRVVLRAVETRLVVSGLS